MGNLPAHSWKVWRHEERKKNPNDILICKAAPIPTQHIETCRFIFPLTRTRTRHFCRCRYALVVERSSEMCRRNNLNRCSLCVRELTIDNFMRRIYQCAVTKAPRCQHLEHHFPGNKSCNLSERIGFAYVILIKVQR